MSVNTVGSIWMEGCGMREAAACVTDEAGTSSSPMSNSEPGKMEVTAGVISFFFSACCCRVRVVRLLREQGCDGGYILWNFHVYLSV